ncbi:DUF1893 domain-containing protein [Alkaliphilus pronyensis]|uniref:DUF1893 domain-containing protein n=1 Tax=Alkaliphilus pronyensis TaxID=1482732 RepID=A0A6I0F6V0_9FIRM|nr:DUF1893 domain-containing protein [Alkaliphilus pronyensis]KAB3537695.1 DUF1893 domain-containing protein [Alkaliphilus pronyensis]
MLELELAKRELMKGNFSCVLVKDGEVCYTSVEKGIKPLMLPLIHDKSIFQNMVLADKVIGKAAALLIVFSSIQMVFAETISSEAKKIFEENNIMYEYEEEVPYIYNRVKSDMCPIEKLVKNTNNPQEAFQLIKEFLL